MGSLRPATGPIPKPTPKKRGGKSPRDSGIGFERKFVKKHGYKRVVGSGAFGLQDPMLKGDVEARIGDKDYLLETKNLNKVDGRGEKTVTFPLSFLEKITKEAEAKGRIPGLIYHPKGSSKDYLFVEFDWFKELVEDYVRQIKELQKEKDDTVGW